MSTSFDSNVSISPDVMVRQIGEETVLLDLKTERYLGLDDVSSRIWQEVTAGVSIQTAYETLLSEYEVEPETLRKDVDDFVQELVRLGLIKLDNEV
jgi:hypothetical protein